MKLRLAFDFSLGGEDSQQHGGIVMSSEWAEKAAQRVRERQEAADQTNAVLIEKRKLLKEQAPGLWQQVFCRVQVLITEFNAEYKHGDPIHYVTVSTSEFKATFRTEHFTNELTAEFKADSSQDALRWCYGSKDAKGGWCSLVVSSFSGKVAFLYGLDRKSVVEGKSVE